MQPPTVHLIIKTGLFTLRGGHRFAGIMNKNRPTASGRSRQRQPEWGRRQ